MHNFFNSKKLLILLTGIIFLFALIGFTSRDRDSLTWPERFFKDSIALVEGLFNKPAHGLASFFDNWSSMQNLREENQLLKANLDQYAQTAARLQLMERRVDELEKLLKLKDSLTQYDLIQAEVVYRNPDRWSDHLTINKGSVDGIENNMAVITDQGLIGRVDRVSKFSATVQLLTNIDLGNHISAIAQGKEDEVFGLLEGYEYASGQLIMRKIPLGASIVKGDTIITSGLGGVFPAGLFIGTVTEVMKGDNGLTQEAKVEPAADFYRIDYVAVVKRDQVVDPATALTPDPAPTSEEQNGRKQ
ncbi:rod shape-determining protein MreC [Rubeoparvulum massiliense]|uniref:rod shape-determining protein MreC n=1 Tax=Rubeoparvulum massiliense TaxID=1631346 RepID=UPI000B0A6946|nr:rod shape-determining protein MreC [Rubeoparvulum massiliense]